jgi:hypothetical protein
VARPFVDPQGWVEFLFAPPHTRLCAAFTAFSAVMPPDGFAGVDLCPFHLLTGLPCPGCGVTRSASNLLRGDVARAINYHAFGPVLLPPIFLLGLLALAPRRWRDGVRDALLTWAVPIRRAYLAVAGLFLLYGFLRVLAVYQGWVEFPAAWL